MMMDEEGRQQQVSSLLPRPSSTCAILSYTHNSGGIGMGKIGRNTQDYVVRPRHVCVRDPRRQAHHD